MKQRKFRSYESAMLSPMLAGRSYKKPMATTLSWIELAVRRTKKMLAKVKTK